MTTINRPYFVEWLLKWFDQDVIKVVTGIRRCGKTMLFELFRQALLEKGIAAEQIVSINFEDPDVGEFKTFSDAWRFIREKMDTSRRNYVFLDEVQLVPEFERLVDGLYAKKDCDIYITGSNAKFLSGELATFLTGRYVEIQMQPLSFAEYRPLFSEKSAVEAFRSYVRFGGFPFAAQLPQEARVQSDYVSGVLNTILYKDIFARKGIRDEGLLRRLVRFVFDNIGNQLSVNRIVGTFKADGIAVQTPTLDAYLDALCESFLVYRALRYDIKGRECLKTNAKYYVADPGLRRVLLGDKGGDFGHLIENIVYLELLRRYREVYVGAMGASEVDFVVLEDGAPRYFQVALSVRDAAVLSRELAPLQAIHDQYPKVLLTLDEDPPLDYNGIQQVCLTDFLLNKDAGKR